MGVLILLRIVLDRRNCSKGRDEVPEPVYESTTYTAKAIFLIVSGPNSYLEYQTPGSMQSGH